MSSAPRWPSPPPVYTPTHQHYATTSNYSLRPYLTLPYLLSLSWVAHPILALIFVVFRLQLSGASAQNAVEDAKKTLLSSCLAAEKAATVAVSLPRYMATSTNKHITEAVNGTLQGARGAFIISLTILEAVIEFIIDAYRSTFLCFVELVIRGGLSILIGAAKEVTDFVNKTISGAASSIQNDIVAANGVIASAVSGINKLGSPFGLKIDVPQFNVPSLSQLQAIQLPTTFQDSLTKLNSTIPTFDDIREKLDSIIAIPFDLVKKDINDTFASLNFEVTPLPVPQAATVTFCGDLDTGIIDDLGRDLVQIAKIGTIILVVLALLMILGNCAIIWYRWRRLQTHLENTRRAWATDPTLGHSASASGSANERDHHVMDLSNHNLMTLMAASQHPLVTVWAHRFARMFRFTPTQATNLRFILHYIFHGPALACFLIGFFGLISVQLQLFAVKPIAAQYSTAVANSVADFSTTIAGSLNDRMRNDSLAYANDINGRIISVESVVNDDLFGWVNGTTSTLNNTLVEFYNEVQEVVEKVFGGTILEQPAQEFIKCILGSKVLAVEHALTFLHDNLHINIPKVSQDVLLLSNGSVAEVARPISLAAVGSGNADEDDGGLVGKLVARYVKELEKERIMMAIFLGIWLFILFCALMIVFWHSYVGGWVHEWKRRRWAKSARGGMNDVIVPWRSSAPSHSRHSSEDNSQTHLVEADEKGFSSAMTLRNEKPSSSTSASVSYRRPSNNSDPRAIAWDALVGSNSTKQLRSSPSNGSSGSSSDKSDKEKREPGKLKALGRHALEKGEPGLLPDEPRYQRERQGSRAHLLAAQVPATVSGTGAVPQKQWFQRFIGLARSMSMKDGSKDGHSSDGGHSGNGVQAPSPRRPRTKPNLTIDTDKAQDGGQKPQKSAWSPSPNPKTAKKPTATTNIFNVQEWLPAPPVAADPKRIYISNPMPLAPKSTTSKSGTAASSAAASQATLASEASNAPRPQGHQRTLSAPSRPPYHVHPVGPPPPLRDVPTSVRSSMAFGSPRAVGSPRDLAASDTRSTGIYSPGIRAPGLQAPLVPSSSPSSVYSRQRQDSTVSSTIPFHLRFPESPSGPSPSPGSALALSPYPSPSHRPVSTTSEAPVTPNMNRRRSPSSPDVSAFPWAMNGAAPPRLSGSGSPYPPASHAGRQSWSRPPNPVAGQSMARGPGVAANQRNPNSNEGMRGPPRGHNRTSSAPRLLTIPQHVPGHSRSSSQSSSPPKSSPLREVLTNPFSAGPNGTSFPSPSSASPPASGPLSAAAGTDGTRLHPIRKYTDTPVRKLGVVNRTPSPTNPFASPLDHEVGRIPIARAGPGAAPAIVKVTRHVSSKPVVGSTNPFDDANIPLPR